MSIQDDIFDVDHIVKTQDSSIKDSWERIQTFYYLVEEERNHLKSQIDILSSAARIIKNMTVVNLLKP